MESDRPLDSRKAPCIIYFHEGFSPYLPFALSQAARSNPSARLILLGNQENKMEGISYEHHMLSDYSKRHQEFVDAYQHFHPGCLEDERRCIERWIYLAEFVQKHGIDEFIFLDSDVVLFEEVRSIFQRCRGYDAGGAPSFFAFCAFIKKNLVPDFADWILEQYENPAVMRAWGRRFEAYRRGKRDPGAVIQDMALAQMFIDERGVRVLDLADPQDGKMVDSGHYGRAFQHGTKEEDILIQARPGGPVSTMLHGKRVDLWAVHVNGYYKNHLPGITGWSGPVVRSFFRPNYRRNLKQLCLYLWNGWRFRNYLRRNHSKYLPPHVGPSPDNPTKGHARVHPLTKTFNSWRRNLRGWFYRRLPSWGRALHQKRMSGYERRWGLEQEGFCKEGFFRIFREKFLQAGKGGTFLELRAGDGLVGSLGIWLESLGGIWTIESWEDRPLPLRQLRANRFQSKILEGRLTRGLPKDLVQEPDGITTRGVREASGVCRAIRQSQIRPRWIGIWNPSRRSVWLKRLGKSGYRLALIYERMEFYQAAGKW